jgi:hypothetical protein
VLINCVEGIGAELDGRRGSLDALLIDEVPMREAESIATGSVSRTSTKKASRSNKFTPRVVLLL